MTHNENSTVKVKMEICNKQLCENTDLQHIKKEDCSTKNINETYAYQEYCEAIYIKEELENNIVLTDGQQCRDAKNTDSIEDITSTILHNFHHKEDYLVRKEENLETDVNDDLGSGYVVENNDFKVEIKDELENNLVLADNLINSNAESINLTQAEKGDLLTTEDHLTLSANTSLCQVTMNNEERKERRYSARNKGVRNKSHVCNVCHRAFSKASNLTRHTRIHTDEKSLVGDVCRKTAHKRPHMGEKPYACDMCDMKFSQKFILVTHKRIHTGERPYECDVCYMTFNRSSKLVIHKRTHTNEKSFVCDVCPKKFNTLSYLMRHKYIHTSEKSYVCDVCQKVFNTSSNLWRHKRAHTGEKSYVCDVCDKRFNQSCNLVVHRRIHTGDKPYICDMCSNTFITLAHLSGHKRTHHH